MRLVKAECVRANQHHFTHILIERKGGFSNRIGALSRTAPQRQPDAESAQDSVTLGVGLNLYKGGLRRQPGRLQLGLGGISFLTRYFLVNSTPTSTK